jgi:hypothetical protein
MYEEHSCEADKKHLTFGKGASIVFSMKTKTYSNSAFLEGVTKEEILEEIREKVRRARESIKQNGTIPGNVAIQRIAFFRKELQKEFKKNPPKSHADLRARIEAFAAKHPYTGD